jgi:hypothetical protein
VFAERVAEAIAPESSRAYDPYSPTADAQYDLLREELERFDISGMLARELRKSRIDEALTRQLTKAIRFLPAEIRDGAVLSLIRNLKILYPIFPTVKELSRLISRLRHRSSESWSRPLFSPSRRTRSYAVTATRLLSSPARTSPRSS